MIEKQSNISYRGGAREGAGRPKGSLDKGNAVLREMILEALEKSGGVDYLVEKAESHPQAFMGLIGKVLPLQVTGEEGKDIQISVQWQK
jgi:hypothetical protein